MAQAFDLYESGEAMFRQHIRRRRSGATDEEIEVAVLAWLRDRPGARRGDQQEDGIQIRETAS